MAVLEEVDISAIRYKPRMLKALHLMGFSLKRPSSACFLPPSFPGNDPLGVVIGESDPYVDISGREINHIRAATVRMTAIMVIAFLCSVAIVRRILTATPVLKVVAKVIGEVQALIIFPFVPHFILAIFHMLCFSATLQSLQLWSSSLK